MSTPYLKLISRTFIFFAFLASLLGSAVFVTPAYAAGLTVNSNADTTADDGTCTLREAIDNANSDSQLYATSGECAAGSGTDTVTFDASLSGQTILVASQLDLLEDVTIDGSSLASKITIDGNNSTRVFLVAGGVTATLDSLIVTQGRVEGCCGAGLLNNGTLTITNSLLSANNNNNGTGGAIMNTASGTLTVTGSTISGNSASNGGGIGNANQMTITNSTLSANTSGDAGGGIFNEGAAATLTVTNSTFSGNTASTNGFGSGGGIFSSGPLTVTNSTFSGNSAAYDAGGIAQDNGTLNFSNTIIANSAGGDCYRASATGVNLNNLVKDGSCANIPRDPNLGPLANNGGPTQTFALLANSPAIDAGDDATCATPEVNNLDQRGAARPTAPNGPGGGHCDIGAYEYQDTNAPSVTAFVAPASPTTLNIPITDFTVSEDAILTGYLITESATLPTLGDTGWAASAPTTYPVASMGSFTLYPWAKDAAGHVSAVYSSPASVNITCLSLITVTSNADSGAGTLRQALDDACVGDLNNMTLIDFAPVLSGETITLASTQLELSKNVIIDGSDLAEPITISGNDTMRVFNIPTIPLTLIVVQLDSLTVTKGATIGHGAGLFMGQGTHVTIKNSTFSDNHAGGRGGGIGNQGSLTLIGSTISGNSAASPDGGGGISNESGLTMTNSTISSNIATGATASGGGLFNTGGAKITNSTIFGNSSNVYGGGISTTANLTITNSTIVGNSAAVTGGLQVDGNVTHLRNTIIANNTSTTINSSIHNDCSDTSDYPNQPTPDGDGIMTNLNNLIEDGSCSPSVSGDPTLGPLADNGGPTQTLALLDGSNAIDAGDDATCAVTADYPNYGPGGLDQRGVTRPQGSHCDIGAYEYIDIVAPTVLSSVRFNTNPTNLTNIQFRVTFSEPVAGVDGSDFALTTSSVTGAAITNVNGSGRTYTVTVNTGSGNGTIQLGVVDDDSILDGSNNPLGGIGAANGDFTSGEVYMILKGVSFANVQVSIAGNNVGTHNIAQKYNLKTSYSGLSNGPVRVTSTLPFVASERVAYSPDGGTTWTSHSELMGLPANQVTSSYTFPWYNNLDLNSQLRFGNVGTASTTVTVTVGGVFKGAYTLAPNASQRISYPGLNNGPVKVTSSDRVPIIASMRVAYFDGSDWTSFSEMMGMPTPRLTNNYVFPWYNNVDLNSQLRFGNVGNVTTTVTVTVAGVFKGAYTLAPNASQRISYLGLDAGPVRITSSGNVPIIASMRVAYNNGSAWTDFSEMMGMPANSLGSHYSFPVYDNVRHNSQLRVGNVGNAPTTVTVTINGVVKETFNLAINGSRRFSYVGLDAGPVVIQSSGNVPIIASERVAYFDGSDWTSFAEMMGLPQSQLTTTFLFPWYNNLDLDTQLRVGIP